MLVCCMYSAKIASVGITMPMVFLAIGVVVGTGGATLDLEAATTFHHLAEVTLALLLFADATTLHRKTLKQICHRTRRMLLIGLPLAIVIGAAINLVLLPHWPFWEACLLAALLSPTSTNERLFYGWFGPRGLATALFAVFVAMDFEGVRMINEIIVIAIAAVLVSAFVHGITAKYASELFRLGK